MGLKGSQTVKAMKLPIGEPLLRPSATMMEIPNIAITIATKVGREIISPRKIRARIAVISGQALKVKRALATVVWLIARITVVFASPKKIPAARPIQPICRNR